MADIGTKLVPEILWLTRRRDFKDTLEYVDVRGVSGPWPPGDLYLELKTTPAMTQWHYTIAGTTATLSVPAATVDTMPQGEFGYQLVFKPAGDTGSGECVALGCVIMQDGCCD